MTIPVDFSQTVSIPEAPKEMLSVSYEGTKPIVRINFSSLSIMQECWRKTDYYLNRGLKSNNESQATLFGSAVHSALETFYSAPKSERILPKNFRDKLALMAHLTPDGKDDSLIIRAAQSFIKKAEPLAGLPDDDSHSIPSGLWMLSYYFEKYINDPYETLFDAKGEPYVERSFTVTLHNQPDLRVDAFGKIDVILKNPLTEQILVVDHKTTSRTGSEFLKRIHPNFQYTGYILGAKRALGLDVENFMVNGLQTKSKPKTTRGTPPDFPRQITKRGPEDFEEFTLAMIDAAKQFLERTKSGIWPMATPNACTMYAGCQYHDICSAPKSIRENIIRTNYQLRGNL